MLDHDEPTLRIQRDHPEVEGAKIKRAAYTSPMQCNINAKGKAIRLISGVMTLAIACVLAGLVVAGVLAPGWWWFVVAGTAVGGGFAVFEGWAGWCVVRAMGFKTPI